MGAQGARPGLAQEVILLGAMPLHLAPDCDFDRIAGKIADCAQRQGVAARKVKSGFFQQGQGLVAATLLATKVQSLPFSFWRNTAQAALACCQAAKVMAQTANYKLFGLCCIGRFRVRLCTLFYIWLLPQMFSLLFI